MFSDNRKDDFDNKDKEARDEEQELIRAKTLMNSLEMVDNFISQAKQIQKKLREQEEVISAQKKELADKDEKLAIKDYKLKVMNQQLADKDKQLSDKENKLKVMNQQLADKDKQLTDKENKLSEAQQKASELEMKVNEMNKLSNLIANAAQEGLLKALRTYVNRSKRKTFEKRSFAKTAVLEIANVCGVTMPDDLKEDIESLDDERADNKGVSQTFNGPVGSVIAKADTINNENKDNNDNKKNKESK